MSASINPARRCPGTLSRRSFVRSGAAGFGALTLANLLRLEELAAARGLPLPSEKSMIVLWLWGGPSHMDTFDLKPHAPSEYRGEFRPVRTNVTGIEICEHLPRLAQLADKYVIVRSCHHNSPGHVNSTHSVMTGYPGELVETPPYRPKYPDFWAVTKKVLGERESGLPAHVALPRTRYEGAAYLGAGLDSFVVSADPNAAGFHVPNLAVEKRAAGRVNRRLDLLKEVDSLRRDLDASNVMESMDRFNRQAVSILTSDRAREAFAIESEDPKVRDRYGRHAVGQRCLLARRLVENGARLVTIDFPCVPGQKAFSWDDHASVWNIFEQMKIRLPVLDQVVSALIEDIYARGMENDVLFVVMGEMSHTPKLSNFKGQPGREHWGRSMSLLMSGGGLRMGQTIGSTTLKGDEPKDRPLVPGDLLATWYKYLGVPLELNFNDFSDRPIPILPEGEPIGELF